MNRFLIPLNEIHLRGMVVFLTQYFEPGQSRQEKKQVINEEIREDDID